MPQALLYLHNQANSLKDAADIAMKTLLSGKAASTLAKLVDVSNREGV